MCGLFASLGNITEDSSWPKAFASLEHRGPDHQNTHHFHGATLAFHRLSIRGLTDSGNQPFLHPSLPMGVICNGEIYNDQELKKTYLPSYNFISRSDCEVLLPLYERFSHDLPHFFSLLDAEFACVIWDGNQKKMIAARDPIGIRPLFFGYHKKTQHILFASEGKALLPFCDHFYPFPPGHYYDGLGHFISYRSPSFSLPSIKEESLEFYLTGIKDRLTYAVEKRLHSDAPIGFLLSGGLDSSLVCALAAKSKLITHPIKTFAVGLEVGAIDIKYAEMVAKHIHSEHTNIYFTEKDIISHLKAVIYALESWDVTTIRASVGMFLVCKAIHQQTNIKVLLTGEVSDELFGYKYTDFAPDPKAFQEEAIKRLNELYLYDVLRADRCISSHSLEARVPFGDLDFTAFVMGIPPALKMNTKNMGKWILRQAFEGTNLLPHDILWREKAAFSDAVGHRLVDVLKEFANTQITDVDLLKASTRFPHATPKTKEAYLYRVYFEDMFPGQSEIIPALWMPNPNWKNCQVDDPSARVLPNYGLSGS